MIRSGRHAQRRLLSARVGILGLGGVGGIVAQHLVAAGVFAADSPADLPGTVARWAAATGTPFSMGRRRGQRLLGPARRPRPGRLLELLRTGPAGGAQNGSTEPAPFSFGPSNTTVAALLAHDMIQYLCGGECPTSGRRAALDFTRQRITHTEESTCTCQTT
ncbi:hypothetical protein [Streptomyces sp. NPDC006289]|uniref:hypothetical protein n=1 Tax=Streptomyces sp. NPDC006289 TaxID=3156744 RepID=UPI0033BDD7C8